jgi:hypothetical protein
MRSFLGFGLLLLALGPVQAAPRATENVLLVMLDGLRWQEVFAGAEEELLSKERGGVKDVAATRKKFWRDTAAERRKTLLPFLWNVVAAQGQLFGNPLKQSPGVVTNRLYFSYPGYSELLCGFADPKIKSNDKLPNTNATVLEWLNRKHSFAGKVAAVTSWDVFPFIINDKRSGIPVNAGYAPLTGVPESAELTLLNRLIVENPLLGEETRSDALTFHVARLYLKARKPRILFVSFDETDAQGHAGRYDRLLASAHKNDAYIRELWELTQSMPEYRDKTTLIVTTDHGRGGQPVEWKSHSAKIMGSESWWIGVLGPDTPAWGERAGVGTVTQSQVAATLAALLGENYCAAVPTAGKPLPGVIREP